MKNIINKLIIATVLCFGFMGVGMVQYSNTTLAAPVDYVCDGADIDKTGCKDDGTITRIAKTIINIFSWVVGVVSVIMVIWGGFQFVTSGGDSGKAGKARMTILYAVVGLVVVAMAQVLVKFVLSSVSSTTP